MTFDPMIITRGMLGLIGNYCGKIQLTSDKVYDRATLSKQNHRGINTTTRCRYRQHVNIANINCFMDNEKLTLQRVKVLINILISFLF